jgi:hypothetical protein
MGLLIIYLFFDFYKVAQFLNALDDFRKILRAPEARQCGGSLKILRSLCTFLWHAKGVGRKKNLKR